jgi:hypothetical protein
VDEGDHPARWRSVRHLASAPFGVIMHRLSARIARQLAEFRNHNTEPDYEEQARIILLIVNDERQAEIHEWRATQNVRALGKAK